MEMDKSISQAMGRIEEIKSLEGRMTDIDQSFDLPGGKKMDEIGEIPGPTEERRTFHPDILDEKRPAPSLSGFKNRSEQSS